MNKNKLYIIFSIVCFCSLTALAIIQCHHTAPEKETTDYSTQINGHRFVDLQLPSGLLWAETNVGAQTATDYGDYYAWAEIQTKTDYSQAAYRYGSDFEHMTKYNATDHKTILEPEDDVATARWGAPCRIPTYTEFQELADTINCQWTWIVKAIAKNDTVSGYLITSRRNKNSIFLPASGVRNENHLYLRTENGAYWTSTLGSESDNTAFDLAFYFANFSWYRNDRYVGHSIRAVAPRKEKETQRAIN